MENNNVPFVSTSNKNILLNDQLSSENSKKNPDGNPEKSTRMI